MISPKIWISHRGNITGSRPELENNPTYIDIALKMGYEVEVDVWYIDGVFVLGHDEPIFEIKRGPLEDFRIWCHAKNSEALNQLLTPYACHCFWHENDRMTPTTHHYIWHFPTNHDYTPRSICVLPENVDAKIPKMCYGVCSDYIQRYKKDYESTNPLYFI